MRKLALSMPEAEEKAHFGHPDFRVRNKIFAGIAPDEKRGTLKLSHEAQSMVVAADPEAFTPAAGAWGRQGWTYVHLEHVGLGQLRDLLREAWRITAPKRLVEEQAPSPSRSARKPRVKAKKKLAQRINRDRKR